MNAQLRSLVSQSNKHGVIELAKFVTPSLNQLAKLMNAQTKIAHAHNLIGSK